MPISYYVAIAMGALAVYLAVATRRRSAGLKTQINRLLGTTKPLAANATKLKGSSSELDKSCATLQQQSETVSNEIADMNASVGTVLTEAQTTAQKSNEGLLRLQQIGDEIGGLEQSTDRLQENAASLTAIAEENSTVSEKTELIGEIALQVKILAFNASVEAERAGDSGRSFHVVARDLHELATKTDKAAKEILSTMSQTTKRLSNAAEETYRNTVTIRDFVTKASSDLRELTDSLSDILAHAESTEARSRDFTERVAQIKRQLETTRGEVQSLRALAGENDRVSNVQQQSVEDLNKLVSDVLGLLGGGRVVDIEAKEALRTIKRFKIIDVRRNEEFNDEYGHIKGARLVTIDDKFQDNMQNCDRKAVYLVVCRSGGRSARAARQMLELGFRKVYNLSGGMIDWNSKNLPVQRDRRVLRRAA